MFTDEHMRQNNQKPKFQPQRGQRIREIYGPKQSTKFKEAWERGNMATKSLIMFVLQRYWRLTRSLTMGAQGIIIDKNDRVLLIRHTYRPGWHFPGGGVEANESIESALFREIREEAGVISNTKPELLGIYANFASFPSDHIALYRIQDWQQPKDPKPNHEIAEHRFYSLDNLPPDIHEASKRRLDEIFKGRPRQLMW